MNVQLGTWSSVPSESGAALALSGDLLAVTGPARAVVWERTRKVVSVDAPMPAPGAPRLGAGRLYWGPSVVELSSGQLRLVREAVPQVRPGGGERATTYAWSADGQRLVACLGGDADQRPRALLLHGLGAVVKTLWEQSGVSPRAAWVGQRAAVIGLSDPRAYDAEGAELARVALGAGTVVHLEASADEERLLVVELNQRLTLIRTASWSVADRWAGAWVHGAIAPGGRFAVALGFDGRLFAAGIQDHRFSPAVQVASLPGAAAVAVTDSEVAVIRNGEVRRAALTVRFG